MLLVFIVIKAYELLHSDVEINSVDQLKSIQLKSSEDIVFGKEKAALSVYLFANYKCKYCVRFFKDVLPEVLEKYDGRVKFVFKPVPFSSNQEEMDALLMAVSVYKYGDYKPFHDLLLKDGNVIYSEYYKDYLLEIMNLNSAIANSFFNEETKGYIDNNKKIFNDLKLKGTPTFIINNETISGYLDVKALDKLLLNKL